ncbi:inner membrane protein ALBINO3, chloroplastic-like [Salvia splendens]|uniref:inner membrane protein ALBINO3, chloroplastic-like n=1 Tax=Salvia splendens TaxID=180675 RepID=UPI001C27153F|nr:inner membrane protein ALBINO3, chloroplastic-like [Salvia splendens]
MYRGSVPGHSFINRDREGAHARLRFWMSRPLFLRIVDAVKEHDDCFMQRSDGTRRLRLSSLQKPKLEQNKKLKYAFSQKQEQNKKLKRIKQRWSNFQERIKLETSRLYKQAGVSPLAGCLPTLATIPVWIGLYQALSNVANEGLLSEGFFWIPSLGGPTTIAARQSGAGISWLFPFVDGHPPLGWQDTAAYLVLPVLLVASQYVSMEIMKPPQTDDPNQKNTLLVLKFLPLMIGYFLLSVPSGLSIYWFTNNVLSTAQQVWLRKLGGAKPVVGENASGIISAGRAKRSGAQQERTGERFKQLKEAEKKQKPSALPADDVLASDPADRDSEDESDNEDTEPKDKEVLEEAYASSSAKTVPSGPRRSKRSKRKRAV